MLHRPIRSGSALWGLTHAADMLLFLAGDPEVDFVQGAIICKDSDWDGNRLNVDPGIACGYIRYSNGSTAITPQALVPNMRSAAPRVKSVYRTTAEKSNSEKRTEPSLKRCRSQRHPAPQARSWALPTSPRHSTKTEKRKDPSTSPVGVKRHSWV